MRFLRSKKFLALTAFVVVGGTAAAVALPAVISQSVIADGTAVHFRVVRTIADGFDSGWHVHPGLAVVQVQEGTLQIYQGSCTPKTVGAGDTYIETPYLAVRGIAKGHVAWTATLLTNGPDPPQIPLSSYAPQQGDPCPGIG